MATFGQIPSNINFSKMHVEADITARDALTGLTHGDRCMVTGLADNGVEFFFNGTAWVIAGPQKLQRVDLATATASITLDKIISGGSSLQIRYKLADDATGTLAGLIVEIDGDTTAANYHFQDNSADDGVANVSEDANNGVAAIPGASSPTNSFGTGRIDFDGYDDTDNIKSAVATYQMLRQVGRVRTGVRTVVHEDGGTSAIDTSIVLKTSVGDFVAGGWAELWVY